MQYPLSFPGLHFVFLGLVLWDSQSQQNCYKTMVVNTEADTHPIKLNIMSKGNQGWNSFCGLVPAFDFYLLRRCKWCLDALLVKLFTATIYIKMCSHWSPLKCSTKELIPPKFLSSFVKEVFSWLVWGYHPFVIYSITTGRYVLFR